MTKEFKPAGYNAVSPYLVVKGAQKMVDMLKQIFKASELRRYNGPEETIMHVEVRIDDSIIMIGDSSETYPPNQLLIHVYVPDVDEVYKRAIAAGCQSVEAPIQKEGDPDKRGSFTDFSGNTWAIGTQVNGH